MPSCNRHALRLDPGGRGPKWLCLQRARFGWRAVSL